jgi:hypothetical protein
MPFLVTITHPTHHPIHNGHLPTPFNYVLSPFLHCSPMQTPSTPLFSIFKITATELTVEKMPLKPGKHRQHPFSFANIYLNMVPKSKSTETEENPFLPPPVDLDCITLADKYY